MCQILNLEYNRQVLIIKALNRNRNYKQAANALGVSKRTLQRDIINYNIQKRDDRYQVIPLRKNESQKLHIRSARHHLHGQD